jgi:hypothetical protein
LELDDVDIVRSESHKIQDKLIIEEDEILP